MSALEEIAGELERHGVTPSGFDVKAFLLGYLIGRAWPGPRGAESLLWIVRHLYGTR